MRSDKALGERRNAVRIFCASVSTPSARRSARHWPSSKGLRRSLAIRCPTKAGSDFERCRAQSSTAPLLFRSADAAFVQSARQATKGTSRHIAPNARIWPAQP